MKRKNPPPYRLTLGAYTAYLLIGILLTSCTTLYDPESSQVYSEQVVGIVNSQTTFGQTIYTRRSKINGIVLWLTRVDQSTSSEANRLILNFYEDLEANTPFFSTTIITASIIQNPQIQVSFSPLAIPGDITFYVELSTSGEEIQVLGRQEDCYPIGQAYQSKEPLDADMAFRLSYSYGLGATAKDFQAWMSHLDIIFPLLATLILPGYGLVRLLQLHKRFTPSEQLALSTGLSLAIIPIIYLLATVTHINLTSDLIQYTSFLFTAIVIVLWLRAHSYRYLLPFPNYRTLIRQAGKHLVSRLTSKEFIYLLVLIGIVLSTLGIRLAMIRDLTTPAWVDSIHHGLLTRLIVQAGALPNTYDPYLSIEPTLYHPGFHTSLAYFIQLTGLKIEQGMLIFGQVINALAVLSSFMLASTLTRSQTAGLVAALITGMFTVMPAYYTSWGRYPQLAGLIILPIPFALILSVEHKTRIKKNLGFILGAAIAIAGILIVHYRVALFLICLIAIYLVVDIIYHRSDWKQSIKFYTFYIIIPFLLALALVSMWLVPAIRFTFLPRIAPASGGTVQFFNDFSWNYLTPALGKQAMVLAGVGWIWSGIRKNRIAWVIPGWIVLLFFLANLGALNVPGGNFVNNSSVTIMLFMPISLMAAYLIDELYRLWKSIINPPWHKLLIIIFAIIAIVSSFIGGTQLIAILNPATILTREADIEAIQWVDRNIQDDKVILINPFAWGYGLYAGTDGGAWISALAGNPTMPPPVLYGLGSVTVTRYVNQISEEVIRLHTSPNELWMLLKGNNIEYIFIGARGGPLFPKTLASNPHYEILYHYKNTWVIHLLP
jgi:hypothetical protein